MIREVLEVLPYSISGSLIPAFRSICLLSCENFNESARELVELVCVDDVIMK